MLLSATCFVGESFLLLLLLQARDAEHLAFLQQSVACQELQRKRDDQAAQLEELPRLR
jgi:hypothetical protein